MGEAVKADYALPPHGAPVMHGAIDQIELAGLGLSRHEVIDFSSNINPFGPPASVRRALATFDPASYPDRSSYDLRQVLAERHRCTPEEVLVGNGSNELIHLVARALLQRHDTALVIGPTFGEYAYASQLAGAQVIEWRAREANDFAIDPAAIAHMITRIKPRVVWLCTANNPTGVALEARHLIQILHACEASGSLLVLDRAYATMERGGSDGSLRLIDQCVTPHVIRLYSLTKLYALAGLRLGYLIADAVTVKQITAYQPTWSVNGAAQTAGLAALADQAFVRDTLPQLWHSSDQLRVGLAALGLRVLRSSLPFMLVRTGDGAGTRSALLQHGYLVRDCASFGLPAYVRIAPQRIEQNARLLAAWREVLGHEV